MQFQTPFAVVTPTADGDVLSVIARAPESWHTTSAVARLTGSRSAEGVRLVLRRLVEQGIIERESDTQGHRFRLNVDHLAADAVIVISRQWDSFLSRLTLDVGRWEVPPRYGAVFGSAARGEMKTSSDIDLFLVRPDHDQGDRWDGHVAALERKATAWTGNDVRILWMSESEAAERAGEAVLREILRDGVRITGEPTWLRRIIMEGAS